VDVVATAAGVEPPHRLEPGLDELAGQLIAFDPRIAVELHEHLIARADAWEQEQPDRPAHASTLVRARRYRMLAWSIASRRPVGEASLD
jgi:hypothetical protein